MRLARRLGAAAFALLLAGLGAAARAQEIEFHPAASVHDGRVPEQMRDLAERVLPVYQERRTERYLASLSALQFVAGDYAAADETRRSLRKRLQGAGPTPLPGDSLLLDIFVHARLIEARERVALERAFDRTYRETIAALDDADAYALTGLALAPTAALERDLDESLQKLAFRGGLGVDEAVRLVRAYFAYDARRRIGARLAALGAEDERRRYVVDDKAVVVAADGTRLAAVVARPRAAKVRLPALFELRIRADARDFALESAARGYAGVVVWSRGRARADSEARPFAREGEDAQAAIEWIARQSWSDGRVAMFGDGYSAYAAWAAAGRAPAALKAIATADATAPGVDFPMQGAIFQNDAYRWLHELSKPRAVDEEAAAALASGPYGLDGGGRDDTRWRALYRIWYANGDPCGDLDGLFGWPSAVLHAWLQHPDFDRYWQALAPGAEQFGRVAIPVLSIGGYYARAQAGTLFYFAQHDAARPHADQTLVLGPYGDGAALRGPDDVFGAYELDPAAVVDLHELRYRWFDFILRGATRPALLQDRVNFEVMGADAWRHVPALAAMGDELRRFYLDPGAGAAHSLAETAGPASASLMLAVDLADRSDADAFPAPPRAAADVLPAGHALVYASAPLAQPLEVAGQLLGRLEFETNKKDFDFTVGLYEQLAGGGYVALFDPAYELRASYAADRGRRRPLKPGERSRLEFRAERAGARQLAAGSRLVLVLGVNKRQDQEINLGTGGSVRAEYVESAGKPLQIRWFGASYIDVPVRAARPVAPAK